MCTTNVKQKEAVKLNNKPSQIAAGIMLNLLKHLFLVVRTCFDSLVDSILAFFWEGSKQTIPALDARHSMLAESAVALAGKIRRKELKSETLVTSCIERIKLVNPILNAVTDERYQAALQDAREVDKMIESGLPDDYFKDKPFLGVPFTAKESHAVGGMLHTLGLVARKHTRAQEDAECVRLLRAAGAIPVAVTNVPEINKWQETRNMVFGQTNNPYHAGRTAGGSSGGEAALHAAIAVPISLCSDIGGSTRMPAFYCGLFALNPTAGHTSLKGSVLRSGLDPTMASIGFVSKHMEDLAPLTKVVAGDKAEQLGLDRTVDVKTLKFYYTETAKDIRVSPICKDLRQAMSKVIQKLTEEAPSTDKAPTPYYHEAFNYMYSLWRHEMTYEADVFARQLANQQGEVKGLVELPKKLLGLSEYTLAAILKLLDDQVLPAVNRQWGDQLIKELADDLAARLGSDGVLLFPAAPQPAPYHYALYLRPFNFAYFAILNAIKFPSVQVPMGLNSEGLPLGIQVVAGPRQDALCAAVGKHLQELFGGYVPPCKVL